MNEKERCFRKRHEEVTSDEWRVAEKKWRVTSHFFSPLVTRHFF